MKVELFSPSIASPACGTRPGSEYAHVKRRGKGKAGGGGKNTLIPVTNAKQLAFWRKQQSLCDACQFPRWKHLKTPGWPTHWEPPTLCYWIWRWAKMPTVSLAYQPLAMPGPQSKIQCAYKWYQLFDSALPWIKGQDESVLAKTAKDRKRAWSGF